MRVKWLRRALSNLDEEAAYIALDDPQAAAWMLNASRPALKGWPFIPPWAGLAGFRELAS